MGLNASDQGSTSPASAATTGQIASNASTDISEKGKSSAVTSILAAIQQIIRDVPGSNAVRSDGSGRITVTTTKETMTKVREFVRAENEALLRQAQIQFDIYSVRSSEGSERGVDWNLVLRSLSDAAALKVSSPAMLSGASAGELGFSVLSPSETSSNRAVRFADTSAILKLLSEQGSATQHRPVSLLTLNRQWARKASLGSQAYVSETTPGAASNVNGAVGAPGLKTSTITTGDRYLAQPHILDNNTVVLKFGIGLSSLVGLPSFVSAGQTVQTPEVTNIIDQSTIALKAGQILVITGLSRIVTHDSTRTLGEDTPVGIGGSKKLIRQREDFIIFVRPTIL
jgi:type IVB pilus formation R64 PilN family outer membrane protein